MTNTPRFAVSAGTTYHSPFVEDIKTYPAAGIRGIGLWEYKLEGDRDEERAAQLVDAGLTATFCFPLTPGIFTGNGHFAHPKDPDARLTILCESVRRFAVYQPVAVCILAGAPQPDGEAESRKRVVSAFRRVSEIAADVGVRLALEVISPGAAGSMVRTIPQALDFIADVGADNIGVLLDNWHIANEPLENIATHIDKIVGIQVCDKKPDSRGRFDRALPGEGTLNVEDVIRTAHDAGYDGWYELEIFSDDGTFGEPLANSMWRQPASQVLEAGSRAFESTYARATAAR
ncbi:sugar phosphate isomerase/epimerase [Nonomuraea sp. K274]|uniref:Sugar phosphate isomerase/epimerase n=1 Tax=Nonomuraea cypriaca TaxID=1187855 RepID=A0A931A672_9ACTN|nr:sugar phosphate isomerase/epimerase [Nonomuraea cypriaca]MBF8184788.1 sugar phosphate isomerase/epimerase [Nonomuraea cypriaca]